MFTTALEAKCAAIEFIDRAVDGAVRAMITTNGMKGDDQYREIRSRDEVGATIDIVVTYGDKLQYTVRGEARLTGIDQGWTDATFSLTGDASWHIVAKNFGGLSVNWTVEEKK